LWSGMRSLVLTNQQRREWDENGFFIIRKFATADACQAMLERAIEISRLNAAGQYVPNVLPVKDKKRNERGVNPEDQMANIFRLHREGPFKEFAERNDVLDLVADLLGPELDCFVSQFIFKNHGALGQPWHQDSYYFAFDRGPQVGLWLAITR